MYAFCFFIFLKYEREALIFVKSKVRAGEYNASAEVIVRKCWCEIQSARERERDRKSEKVGREIEGGERLRGERKCDYGSILGTFR